MIIIQTINEWYKMHSTKMRSSKINENGNKAHDITEMKIEIGNNK